MKNTGVEKVTTTYIYIYTNKFFKNMENCSWVVVQKIYYPIIKLILSAPC